MAVNTTEISSVYNSLITTSLSRFDAMWDNNEIDAETYAKVVSETSSKLLELSSDLVLKQLSLDKDIEIKERQMVESELTGSKQRLVLDEEIETANKQQILLDTQEEVEQFKVDSLQPKELESLIKDIDVKERTTQIQETELLDKVSTSEKQRVMIDAQIVKLEADVLITQEEVLLKKAQADRAYAEMLASINKEYGMSYTLDAEGNIERNSIVDDGGGKLDAEVLAMQKEAELVTAKVETEKENTILVTERHESEAKQNEVDGLIDKKKLSIEQDIDSKKRSAQVQETELLDRMATSKKQRLLLDKEIETANFNSGISEVNKALKEYERDVLQIDQHNQLVLDSIDKQAKLKLEYNTDLTRTGVGAITGFNLGVSFPTFSIDNQGEATFSSTAISSAAAAAILKNTNESNVAIRTAKGYEADSYYKSYRSLQELFFAAGNAGIITSDSTGGIYQEIIREISEAMTSQVRVWNPSDTGVDLGNV